MVDVVGDILIGGIYKTVAGVDHIAEGELGPVEGLVLDGGPEGEAHIELLGHLDLEGVHCAGVVGVEDAALTGAVAPELDANATVDLVEMLVIRGRIGHKRTRH